MLLVSHGSLSCPELKGKWVSSKKETMDYTSKWIKLEEKRLEFYEQIFGVQLVEYLEEKYIIHEIPKYKITIEGKEYDWSGEKEIVPYTFLGCTSKQVAIEYELFGHEWIATFNFIDDDMYWIYTGSPNMENSHTREFFKRVKSPNKSIQPTADASAD